VNLEFFIQLKRLYTTHLVIWPLQIKAFLHRLWEPTNFIVLNGCCIFGNQCLFSDTCTHTWPQMSQPRRSQSELLLSCTLSNLPMLNYIFSCFQPKCRVRNEAPNLGPRQW
jgi:hypothetical protein